MESVENYWRKLWSGSSVEDKLISETWTKIRDAYSSNGRHYHTIKHIAQMLEASEKYSGKLQDISNIQLSVFYHDIVYVASKNDNEEQSAQMASSDLKMFHLAENEINKCILYINATKGHNVATNDMDLAYFLDFDLEKLGAPWPEYEEYTRQIRQEYKIYPKLIYNQGRKKVLKHFLALERIFKTPEYFEKYEKQARENMQKEMLGL